MLDPDEVVRLTGDPGILLFRDDREPRDFYALPESPRLEIAEDGCKQLRLLLHGHKEHGEFEVGGGLVQATTSLGLTGQEQARLRSELEASFAERGGVAGATPHLLSPHWGEGRVRLEIDAHLVVEGRPSLFGANQCALQRSLSPPEALAAESAWRHGLPGARITYELMPPRAPGGGPGAGGPVLPLSGPVRLSAAEAARSITRIDLGK